MKIGNICAAGRAIRPHVPLESIDESDRGPTFRDGTRTFLRICALCGSAYASIDDSPECAEKDCHYPVHTDGLCRMHTAMKVR